MTRVLKMTPLRRAMGCVRRKSMYSKPSASNTVPSNTKNRVAHKYAGEMAWCQVYGLNYTSEVKEALKDAPLLCHSDTPLIYMPKDQDQAMTQKAGSEIWDLVFGEQTLDRSRDLSMVSSPDFPMRRAVGSVRYSSMQTSSQRPKAPGPEAHQKFVGEMAWCQVYGVNYTQEMKHALKDAPVLCHSDTPLMYTPKEAETTTHKAADDDIWETVFNDDKDKPADKP